MAARSNEYTKCFMSNAGCSIVEGIPAGALLSDLLARRGKKISLLEPHADFARELRGDTFHGSSMEVMDQLGLLPKVEPLIRGRTPELTMITERNRFITMGKFRKLDSPFPYVAVIPQVDFLPPGNAG